MLVLLSPALGVAAAGIATWHALLAGSFWYMPLGVVIALALISMAQSHTAFDVALLGLTVFAVMTWLGLDSLQQRDLLSIVEVLTSQTSLMAGVLLAMLSTLLFIRILRRRKRL